MLIENKLRKEAPLRSTWEAAVARGMAKERERAVTMFGLGDSQERDTLPPSPVSPIGKSAELLGAHGSPGRLPSPRPSPPPPPDLSRRGSSYIRARSVSC